MNSGGNSVLIVGVGNELLADEGFGVHVVRSLSGAAGMLPGHVDVLEAGTCLLDALPEMARHSEVILVDAVRAGRKPGTIYRLRVVADAIRRYETLPPTSMHEWGLIETLRVAELLGMLPQKLTLLGAEPESMEPSMELSPRLKRAAARLSALLRKEVSTPRRPCEERRRGQKSGEAWRSLKR